MGFHVVSDRFRRRDFERDEGRKRGISGFDDQCAEHKGPNKKRESSSHVMLATRSNYSGCCVGEQTQITKISAKLHNAESFVSRIRGHILQ